MSLRDCFFGFGALLAGCVCGSSDSTPDPAAVPVPAQGPPLRTIQVGGIEAKVNPSWKSLGETELQRLRDAATGKHAGASIDLTAYNPGDDGRPALMVFRMTTAPSDGAAPDLTALVQARVDEAERMATLRKAKSSKSESCDGSSCNLQITIDGDNFHQELRSRIWTDGTRATEVACGCLDDGCAFIEECQLPSAPAK